MYCTSFKLGDIPIISPSVHQRPRLYLEVLRSLPCGIPNGSKDAELPPTTSGRRRKVNRSAHGCGSEPLYDQLFDPQSRMRMFL